MPLDTASLVVALSAQLTKFEKDMRDAGIMADKATKDIEDKFSRMNPQVSASFLGNLFSNIVTKGIEAATNALVEFKDRFLELEKVAHVTGASMTELFGFQEAAKAAGANIEDMLKGIRELGNLLNQMQRGDVNSLSRLFDSNLKALQGINRDTMTWQQALGVVANLVRDAKNNFDKIDAAKMAGFSQDAVPALERGADALNKAAGAAAAGAPNFDAMAASAKKFDETMKEAFTWLKAAVIDILMPILKQDLIDLIAILSLFKGGLADSTALVAKLKEFQEGLRPTTRATVLPTGAGTTVVPPAAGGGATASDYDRTTKSIEKQTAAMEAEAATIGETVGATEEYRVQLLLTEAALRDGKEWTEKLNDEIALTAERAGQSKQALAEHQFALNRLNSASQQVGSALSTAFADAIVEGKSFNDVMKSLIKTLEKAAINSLVMSFFTPGAGQTTSPFSSLFKAQGGTDFAPGGLALVGERGPELVNLPRGSQVLPNDVSRQVMSGGGQIVYSPMIDARGASVEAVARLAQIIQEDKQTFALRTITTIQQARRGRVPGL
jgi:hypothetical protein